MAQKRWNRNALPRQDILFLTFSVSFYFIVAYAPKSCILKTPIFAAKLRKSVRERLITNVSKVFGKCVIKLTWNLTCEENDLVRYYKNFKRVIKGILYPLSPFRFIFWPGFVVEG